MITFLSTVFLLALSGQEPQQIDSTVLSETLLSHNTPVTYAVIDGSDLVSNNPQNSIPMSLSSEVSVVSTSEGGTGLGYTNMRIRGVGGYHTNVTFNGITLNDAESQEVFWVNIPALQNIVGEIIIQRGLGTSSNGPGAFGASINMKSTPAGMHPSGHIESGYGSYNTFTSSVKASTGILRNGFFAQGAYCFERTDGYMENASAKVQSIFGETGWRGKDDSVRLIFLQGIQHSGITWNGVPIEIYENNRRYNSSIGDTDNYSQEHLQMNWIHMFGPRSSLSLTLNHTGGKGYYEISSDKDWLDNSLGAALGEFSYSGIRIRCKSGIYASSYKGRHYGPQYDNDASKKEIDFFVRAEADVLSNLIAFADLNLRGISYTMNGPDEYSNMLDYGFCHSFFNPRCGLTWKTGRNSRLYGSFAIGNREPSRADIQSNPYVEPERLQDFEAGYEINRRNFSFGINLYWMKYKDMLLETGVLDDAGYAIKENIPEGNREGIEFSATYRFSFLEIKGNLTCSSNRTSFGTEMLLSPPLSGMVGLNWKVCKGLTFSANHKFVSRQFWDNTGNPGHVIPAYDQADIALRYKWTRAGVNLHINNLWNKEYFAYAHSFGVFPQATRNCMAEVYFEF